MEEVEIRLSFDKAIRFLATSGILVMLGVVIGGLYNLSNSSVNHEQRITTLEGKGILPEAEIRVTRLEKTVKELQDQIKKERE